MIGAFRTCVTLPWKTRCGKASTVKFTSCPTTMFPTSASATLESICMFARSLAMVKIIGALKLAATVWPTGTGRGMTMPSTGE